MEVEVAARPREFVWRAADVTRIPGSDMSEPIQAGQQYASHGATSIGSGSGSNSNSDSGSGSGSGSGSNVDPPLAPNHLRHSEIIDSNSRSSSSRSPSCDIIAEVTFGMSHAAYTPSSATALALAAQSTVTSSILSGSFVSLLLGSGSAALAKVVGAAASNFTVASVQLPPTTATPVAAAPAPASGTMSGSILITVVVLGCIFLVALFFCCVFVGSSKLVETQCPPS